MRLARLVLCLLPLAWAAPSLGAEPAVKKETTPVSYYRQVRPIFQQHCQGCHQPAKPQGGYIMTEHADLFKKTDTDVPGVVPGKPEQSKLVEQILPLDGKAPAMPKGRDALSEKAVALVRTWITQGAKD